MKKFSRWILKIAGWKTVVTADFLPKSVICVAPHTSNWDFILGRLFYSAIGGGKVSFLMKKSWFFFPLGFILKALGGVAVDRSKHTSVTQQMIEEFDSHEQFHLGITPEGTRKLVGEWKMGFYYIAKGAGVPIQLAYIDYGKKEMGITKNFIPTDDEKSDIEKIKDFYKNVQPKFPGRFETSKPKE